MKDKCPHCGIKFTRGNELGKHVYYCSNNPRVIKIRNGQKRWNAVELFCRFVAGGGLIVLISLLSQTKYSMISGVIMLFPAVTLVGYYFIGPSMSPIQLQSITKVSIYALSTTFIFLMTFYYSQEYLKLNYSLFASLVSWCISAVILYFIIR